LRRAVGEDALRKTEVVGDQFLDLAGSTEAMATL
jgi:hypothetical protein